MRERGALQLSEEGAVALLGGGHAGQLCEALACVVCAEEGGCEEELVVGRGAVKRRHLHPPLHREGRARLLEAGL